MANDQRAHCLFCRIVDGALPSKPVFQDDRIYAFHDVNPQAPAHVLVVPRQHIATLNDLTPEEDALVGHLVRCATRLAQELGHGGRGYRLVWNCGAEAGQSVFHIHLHLLAGRRMGWPLG